MNVLALLGSARSDGDAARLLETVVGDRPARRVDLGTLPIEDYAYGQAADRDAFLGVAEAMAGADAILFVTPVYWYAMSGVLKRFFDRLTDLVTVDQALGRRLAGRSVWVAACGSEPDRPEGFEVPFRRTAAYFGMQYGGMVYVRVAEGRGLSAQARRDADAFGAAVFGGCRVAE